MSEQEKRLMPQHLKWALSTVSGCLNGAAFIFYGPLALIANLPLLIALRYATSWGEALSLGAWVGFLGGIHIFGVLNYGWWIFWAFSFYTASQMILFSAVLYGFRVYFQPKVSFGLGLLYELLTPAVIWTLTEWLRTVGPVALPASYVGCIADIEWLNPLLAWASVLGGLGVSALIALIPASLWLLFSPSDLPAGLLAEIQNPQDEEKDTRTTRQSSMRSSRTEDDSEDEKDFAQLKILRLKAIRSLSGLLGLLIIGVLYGWAYWAPLSTDGDDLRVAGLQGGFTNEIYHASEADPLLSVDIIETYENLLQEAKTKEVDLIVWGESAIRVPVINTPELRQRLLPQSKKEPWLIGGLAHTDPDGKSYNLAFSAHDQRVIGRYAKVKTVPGVEAKFTAGKEWTPLPTEWGAVGILICFESIYPHAGRALAQAGARLLIVLSNDAGFGESPISHHMTNRAIVRAVETGRWLLRVGQAGVTTLIDPQGKKHGTLGLFQSGILYGTAKLRGGVTPFVRIGVSWLWGFLCFLLIPWLVLMIPKVVDLYQTRELLWSRVSNHLSQQPKLQLVITNITKLINTLKKHLSSSKQSSEDEDPPEDDPFQ